MMYADSKSYKLPELPVNMQRPNIKPHETPINMQRPNSTPPRYSIPQNKPNSPLLDQTSSVRSPIPTKTRYPTFQMPELCNKNFTNTNFSLPKSFFSKSPSTAATGRTRQAPKRLQIDPTKKAY